VLIGRSGLRPPREQAALTHALSADMSGFVSAAHGLQTFPTPCVRIVVASSVYDLRAT
jgi:hypothetical protein